MPSKGKDQLGAHVTGYLDARKWALEQNIQDARDAFNSGYYLEIIHFLGAEAPTVLSQRMELRRAFARREFIEPGAPKPNLPKIQPGRLTVS